MDKGSGLAFVVMLLLVAFLLFSLAMSDAPAQAQPAKEPQIEFNEIGGGFFWIDQLGDGAALAVRRTAIQAIAYHDPSSRYAKTVYKEKAGVYLVVITIGAAEYRVRCPTKERAAELIEFITEADNGQGQD